MSDDILSSDSNNSPVYNLSGIAFYPNFSHVRNRARLLTETKYSQDIFSKHFRTTAEENMHTGMATAVLLQDTFPTLWHVS